MSSGNFFPPNSNNTNAIKRIMTLALDVEYLHFPAKKEVFYPIRYIGSEIQSKIKPLDTRILHASIDFYIFTNYRRSLVRGYFLIGIGYMDREDIKISESSDTFPGMSINYKGSSSAVFGAGLELKVSKLIRGIIGWRTVGSSTTPGWSAYQQLHLSIGYIL